MHADLPVKRDIVSRELFFYHFIIESNCTQEMTMTSLYIYINSELSLRMKNHWNTEEFPGL